jgi:hypothetical protein
MYYVHYTPYWIASTEAFSLSSFLAVLLAWDWRHCGCVYIMYTIQYILLAFSSVEMREREKRGNCGVWGVYYSSSREVLVLLVVVVTITIYMFISRVGFKR